MKRLLAILLSASMVVGIPATALAEENVTLDVIFYTNSLTKEMGELEYIQKMAEEANVTLEIEQISSGWDEIKSTLLASGDIPDLIMGKDAILSSDVAQFKGLFADMSGMIDEYAPNIRKAFDEHPELEYLATSEDGTVYGIPKYQRFWPKTYIRQMINQEWLDNLGLESPRTFDELYNVLLAFKEQDANGNGDPGDEIPMDFAAGVASHSVYQIPWALCLLCGYGIPVSAITDDGWYLEEGEVKNIYMSDEYFYPGLRYLCGYITERRCGIYPGLGYYGPDGFR